MFFLIAARKELSNAIYTRKTRRMPGDVGEAKLDLWRTTDRSLGLKHVELLIYYCKVPYLGAKL
jgi:hypothetical protein